MSYFERLEVEKECALLVRVLEIVRKKKGIESCAWSDDNKANTGMIKNLLQHDYPQLSDIAEEILSFTSGKQLRYIADLESKSATTTLGCYELAWHYMKQFSCKKEYFLSMPRLMAESIAEKLHQELSAGQSDTIFCCSENSLPVLLALSKYDVQVDLAISLTHNTMINLIIELIKLIGRTRLNVFNLNWNFKSVINLPEKSYEVGFYSLPMGMREHWLLSQENFNYLATHSMILLEPAVIWSSKPDLVQFRKMLVEKGYLRSVIQLPLGVLSSLSVSPTLLLLNKSQVTDKFLLADFSSEKLLKNKDTWTPSFDTLNDTKALTFIDEIRRNEYVLDPKRYESGDGSLLSILNQRNSEPLESIADITRAQSIPVSKKMDSFDVETFSEVSTSDIDDVGFVSKPKKIIQVDEDGKRRAFQAELHEGDIVLAIKGSIGKVGFITENTFLDDKGNRCRCVAGQSFVIIRLKPYKQGEYSPEYLFRYLKTKIVQKYFESFSLGTAIRMLKMSDVTNLPVKIPSWSELEREKELNEDQIRIKRKILELQDKLYQSEMAWPK